MNELPILACSLSGPEQKDRASQWSQVIDRATSREVRDGAIVSRFPPDPNLLGELRRLIEAESECCAFMAFEVTETPSEVMVEVRVPQEFNYVLAAMFGPVTEAASGGSR